MPLSIEELRKRLHLPFQPDPLQKMAREKGYRYFRLKEYDRYAIYDNETNEKVSGKKLISAKEAIEIMSTRVRHGELHTDNGAYDG